MTTDRKLLTVGGGDGNTPLDTDPTMAKNSDERVASQKAAKAYADSKVNNMIMSASEMTASGALPDASLVVLNHATTKIEATLAAPAAGRFLVITQADAGTAGHTVTLTAGTYDGTNDIATFNAAGETLVLFGVSATRFVVVENIGSVAFS